MQKIDSMSQFNNIAPTRRDCSECLSLVLRLETALLKIESLFNEIDRCLDWRALPPSSKLSQSQFCMPNDKSGTSGSMSGDGKRSVAEWPKLPRPSSTLPIRTQRLHCAVSAFRVQTGSGSPTAKTAPV